MTQNVSHAPKRAAVLSMARQVLTVCKDSSTVDAGERRGVTARFA
jgi:hypothetical protein